MTSAIEPFPIDFSKLEKGQTISADDVSRIYGVIPHSTKYQLALMKLQNAIEINRTDLVLRQTQGALCVLTDLQASDYLESRANSLVSGLRRNARRVGRINTSEFTDAQKQLHGARERMAVGVAMSAEKERRSAQRELLSLRTEQISAGDDDCEGFSEVG